MMVALAGQFAARLDTLERTVQALAQRLDSDADGGELLCPNRPATAAPAAVRVDDAAGAEGVRACAGGELRIVGLKTRWFVGANHPPVQVVLSTAPPHDSVGDDTWLHVAAVNAFGQRDDGILDEDSTRFRFNKAGVAVVDSLKFLKVTSQNGGWFVLHMSVPDLPGVSATSERLNVRCSRMKCERKADCEADLAPDDDIARVPGMGKAYAQRWKALGFHSVADLAGVDMSAAGRPSRMLLLGQLRKNRGALTEKRFMDLLRLAARVVARADGPSKAERQLAALAEGGGGAAAAAGAGPGVHKAAIASDPCDLVALMSTTTTTTTTMLAAPGESVWAAAAGLGHDAHAHARTKGREGVEADEGGSCASFINWDALVDC